VYLEDGTRVESKAIKSDKEYVYIEPVPGKLVGGVILLKPGVEPAEAADTDGATFELAAAQDIPGVYQVNTSIAVFKPIVISEGDTAPDGYYLLSSELNKKILAGDSIAANADKVEEGKMID
jgi:hypothetical protein